MKNRRSRQTPEPRRSWTRVSFVCPRDLLRELTDIGRYHGTPLTFVLQDAVEQYVDDWMGYEGDAQAPREGETPAARQPLRLLHRALDAEERYNHSGMIPSAKDPGVSSYEQFRQNSRMTLPEFVKSRFIPEHVMSKSFSGRRHYQAILKHILKPETVVTLFDAENAMPNRLLAAISDWPYLDDVRLCDMHAGHVQRIISAAVGKGYSMQTIKHIRNVTGAILNHATKRHCFSGDNPAFQVPLPGSQPSAS